MSNPTRCTYWAGTPIDGADHVWEALAARAVGQRCIWCDTWRLPNTPAAEARMVTQNARHEPIHDSREA